MTTEATNQQPLKRPSKLCGGLGRREFIIVLAVLFLVTFASLLTFDQSFIYRDFGAFGYPLAFHARESWLAGEVPLWNPYNNCGLPFMAQWNTMALYPCSAFYYLLPVEWALSWFCILHLYLGGVGMFVLARRWFGSDLGAAIAGVSFAFSGLAFNCLLWPNNAAALGWMPWVLLALQRAVLEGGRWPPIAALVGALQVLTGAPEVIFQTWMLSLLIVLWPIGGLTDACIGKRLLRWFTTGVLVAGLTAVQLLPFVELLAHSHRSSGFSGGAWAMPSWGWGSFLVPLLHSFSWVSGVYGQPDQYWISSYYLGAFVLVLAIMGALCARGRAGLVLGGAVLIALVLALGNAGGLYPLLIKMIPGGGLVRYPVKFVVAATLLLPLLAAHGVRWLETDSASRPTDRKLLAAGLAAALAMGALLLLMKWRPLPFDEFKVTAMNTLWRGVWLGLALALLWLALRAERAAHRLGCGVGVLLVLWLDLFTHTPALILTAKTSALAPNLAVASGAPAIQLGHARVMLTRDAKKFFFERTLSNAEKDFLGKRLGGYANMNLLDHQPKVDGLYSLYPAWHYDLVSAIYNRTNAVLPALAFTLAASHQTASDDVFSWNAFPSALPMVTAGQRPEILAAGTIVERIIADEFDPSTTLLLEDRRRNRMIATNRANAAVKNLRFSAHEITFETTSDKPTWAVISQTWYPAWRAWVNGEPATIERANHAFQAVPVPAGVTQVRLVYVDRKFRLGAVMSGLSLTLCLGWWWRTRKSKSARV